MKNIFNILRREFSAYFNSPIAYIFITAFLIINNWLFFNSFFIGNQANMRSFFSLLPWIFLFFVPAISMRLWAEEKRLGTFETLLTLPVRDYEVVMGKYLAGFLFLSLAIILTITVPITIAYIGALDKGPVIGGYVGAILLGGAYLAIGIFASGLTVNQVIGFLAALSISFILLIIGEDFLNLSGPIAAIVKPFALGTHFENISRGAIDTRDIFYYFSVIVFFLSLNTWSIGSRKWRG
jgi:ABC-2 type transport system permease protein